MTPKQIEFLLADLWALVERPTMRNGAPSVQVELRRLMMRADPRGVFKATPLSEVVVEPLDVSLRDSPRLPKLIGEHEAGIHD